MVFFRFLLVSFYCTSEPRSELFGIFAACGNFMAYDQMGVERNNIVGGEGRCAVDLIGRCLMQFYKIQVMILWGIFVSFHWGNCDIKI